MSLLSILSFLNFVIRRSDDSGINEKFLSYLHDKNKEKPKELEYMDILSIYPRITHLNYLLIEYKYHLQRHLGLCELYLAINGILIQI